VGDRTFEICRGGMEVGAQAVVMLPFPPGFLDRVCLGESCGKFDDADGAAVLVEELPYRFCFQMPGRLVNEEDYAGVFAHQLMGILQKVRAVAFFVRPVQMGAVIGKRSVGTGFVLRSGRFDPRPSSLRHPDALEGDFILKDAFILNYDSPASGFMLEYLPVFPLKKLIVRSSLSAHTAAGV